MQIKEIVSKVFRKKGPDESVQDWLNDILDTIFEDYHKLVVGIGIAVAALAAIVIVGVNHYGFIKDPAVCQMCHSTFYKYSDYAPYPHQEPMTGVSVGCAECHPYPFKEFKNSVHHTAVNGIRPGCVTCHGTPHTVWDFNKYMFLLGPSFWSKAGSAGISPGGAFWDISSPMANQGKWETIRPRLAKKVREQYLANDSAPCRSCHNIDNLIAVENPEKPWVMDIHTQVKQDKKTCIECHFNLVHAAVEWEEPAKPTKEEKPAEPKAGSGVDGAAIYKQNCASCHGETGKPVLPGAPNFSMGERLGKTDEALLNSVKNGVLAMPGFTRTLSYAQITAVLAHIRTLSKAAEPAAGVGAATGGHPEEGKKIFGAQCAACHGADGAGLLPGMPSFAKGERLEKSDADLANAIKKGIKAMPPFAGLSDEDVQNVISYIRVLKK
ncbi:MAG: c-type cytochrome [Nitrospirota bacterium]|nr:c-type cytochrome [Nitrospirota bacterium]